MGQLDSRGRQGALLDATGHSNAQIQSVLGVSESTVSRWRRLPEYKAEVARLQERHVAAIEPLIERVKEGVTSGMIEASNALREALDAKGEDGLPLWDVRIEAARALAADFKGMIVTPAARAAGELGDGEGGAVQQMTIVIGSDALPEGGVAVRPGQTIEGTATEIGPGG